MAGLRHLLDMCKGVLDDATRTGAGLRSIEVQPRRESVSGAIRDALNQVSACTPWQWRRAHRGRACTDHSPHGLPVHAGVATAALCHFAQ